MNQSEGGSGLARLLHDLAAIPLAEWTMAMLCALLAAIAYELVVKAAFKATRKVTLKLPFILLYLTRAMMSGAKWRLLHPDWRADLYDIIDTPDGRALGRYLRGMRFSVSLLLFGAIRTARNTATPAKAQRGRRAGRAARKRLQFTELVEGSLAVVSAVIALLSLVSGDHAWSYNLGAMILTSASTVFTGRRRLAAHRRKKHGETK
ncbi:hypothetical protein Kpho02_77510 [Kitasatospora phosalacinea]|uniref:Uncharacterized protein n=1 Tax=Kitasatospora phosalacinea TaxID=2065 RepID=A0A9W6V4F3_9ACTN|nr:hypothetical protein [Kitasatospora phosalacinea]GLW75454.1 hypothetical protein Kpho02_77510 [Kitasatospora phosalacinea]